MLRRGARWQCACLAAALVGMAAAAQAGNPTRIQLVATIPAFSMSVTDVSGEIAGEVDGIAT
ncbi:MAG: hypothetical protein AAEJ53_14770, partial [Myxococcota bacterium]